jgi:hypothetical protein
MNPWEEDWSGASKQGSMPWEEDWGGRAPAAKKNTSDAKTALIQGFKEVPGAITGLADIPAGLVGLDRPFSRAADAVGEITGFQPSKSAKADEAKYSDAYKAQKAEIDAIEADPNKGFVDMAKFYAQNPEYTGLNIVRSVPSMALGGLYGRALKGIGGSAVARGAAGEGAVMAGQQMEGIDKNVDPQRAATASLGTGVIGGSVGLAGGRIAQKMGIADIDTLMAGGGRGTGPVDLVKRGIVARSATGTAQEGLLEELPQSLVEQGAKNLAEAKPLTEGMMRAGIEGTLAGGTLGGAMGAISRSRARQPEQTNQQDQTEEPDQAAEVAQAAVATPPPAAQQDMPAPPAGNPLIEQQQAEQEQEAQAQEAKAKRDAIISKVGGVVPIAGTNMSLFNGKPYHNDDPDGALDKQIAKLQEAEDQKPPLRKQVESAYVDAFNNMNKTAIANGEKKPLTFANITSSAAKLIGAAPDLQDAASRIGAQIDLKVGPTGKVSPEVELLQDVYKRLTGQEHPSVARVQEIQNKEKESAKPKPSVVQPAAKASPVAAPAVLGSQGQPVGRSANVGVQPTSTGSVQPPAAEKPRKPGDPPRIGSGQDFTKEIKDNGGYEMPLDRVAKKGDEATSPWLMPDGTIIGTGQDHISVTPEGDYAQYMKRTGAVRASFFHDIVEKKYAAFLHTAEGQKLTPQQISTLQALSDANNGNITIKIGETDKDGNPAYEKEVTLDELRNAPPAKKSNLVTVTRQGKQVQLPRETIAKDYAKALADPKKSQIIQDITGTGDGATMTFKEAAIASLARQKKATTETAVENERKRIHKMLAGLGITETVVDRVSAMGAAPAAIEDVSEDPDSGVSIVNSPNASVAIEPLTPKQKKLQGEADKIMKEQADVKTPDVTTAKEQEIEAAILEKRKSEAESNRQKAIAEAARSPYASEVREDWDDMPDVLDGVTPKFDELTLDEMAELVEYYTMYKNGDFTYREFEKEQRDIARRQETTHGRQREISNAPSNTAVREDDSEGKGGVSEDRPGGSRSVQQGGTPSTESGSSPAKAPVVAIKKKRAVAKPEEKKSVLQTATEAFKKWFDDSKVVDKDGKPLVVYHGTHSDIDTFQRGEGILGAGIYLGSKDHANIYASQHNRDGGQVLPVYVSIQNPLEVYDDAIMENDPIALIDKQHPDIFKGKDISSLSAEQVTQHLEDAGYDGVIHHEGKKGGENTSVYEYVAFNPSQVKSATGNNGKFDASNPSITDAAQDFKDALSDLGDILTKVGRANLTPEQDKDLLGVLTKLVGAAIRMGYSSLEQATRFVLDSVKKKFGAKAVPVTPVRVKTAYQSSSIIERNVSKLPPSLQGPAFIAATNIKDLIQRGVMGLSFGHDLADMVAKTLPSAKKFFDAMDRKEAVKNRLEIEIDKIATEAYKVPDKEALNKFLKKSTRDQKWGYQPSWLDKVEVNPTAQAAYNALSAQSKAVADKIFKHGYESRKNMAATVRAEINAGFDEELKLASEADKAKIQEKRKAEMHLFDTQFNSFKGPYAPLSRFGDFVMVAKSQERIDAEKHGDTKWLNKEGTSPMHYRVEFHDSLGAAKWAAKQLEGTYANTVGATKQAYAKGMSEAPWSALRRLKMMVNEHFKDNSEEGKKATAQINQLLKDLYLSNLAESAARKHDLKRKDIEGASDDMLRAFASKGKADAHFMAALMHTGEVQDALTEMRNEAHGTTDNSSGRADRTNAFNEILRRHAGSMDYRPTPVQDKILMLNSVWMLLTKPAYYLQNATQPFMMSLPVMAGRHGYMKSASTLTQAYRDLADGFGKDSAVQGFLDGNFDIDAMPIKADEKVALKKLLELGILDIGINMDMGYWESRGGLGQGAVDAVHKMTTLVKQVEVMNRVSTALAAYRLAGGGTKGIEEAKQVVRTTHGNYSTFNAPSLLNKVPKLFVQFRKFQLIQLALMSRLAHQSFKGDSKEVKAAARASLTYTLGHYFAMAGALGMPAMSLVGMGLAAAFGDEEEPEDFELLARRAIGNEEVADILLKGAPTMAGMDLSGTLGAGNMTSILPFTDIKLDSKKGYAETMLGLLGPAVGGTAPRIADGIGFMQKGEIYKGFEKMLPNGLANAMKAYREATEGMSNKNNDMTLSPEEISLWDSFLTSMSIRTQTAAKTQLVQGAKIDYENFYKERTGEIKHRYVKAWKEGDGDTMAEMRQEWQDVQMSKAKNGFAKQPMSDLVRAPREQMKRERNTAGGVQFQKGSRRFVHETAGL